MEYEDSLRIAREVTLGQSPERPDSPDEAEFRVRVARDIAAIAARGGVVELPAEMWPDVSPARRSSRAPDKKHQAIQGHFHTLIREVVAEWNLPCPTPLPDLASILRSRGRPTWFAITGMHGGFSYWLEGVGERTTLIAEHWSRVFQGCGQRHEVTVAGARLVEDGIG